jgi:site-specific recombinase XerD
MSTGLVRLPHAEVVSAGEFGLVPAAVAGAGDGAARRFVEFFTASIRNPNTRRAYHRSACSFFRWCEVQNLSLPGISPFHVAAYVEGLCASLSAPTVKQHLAAVRMLFDYLVVGQVVRANPAHSVRGPSFSAKKGKTAVLTEEEARDLLASIKVSRKDERGEKEHLDSDEPDEEIPILLGLRDRALLAVMVYSFARVGAALGMNVEDYYPQGKRWWFRLHEKGGKRHEMPAHRKAEDIMDAYLEAAGIRDEKKAPLFRTAAGKSGRLTGRRMSTADAYRMVRRRAKDAGIITTIGCHTFRATGITNYLEHGGSLEKAQAMANHESARTTKLYDRREDRPNLDEVERIAI